MSIGGPEICDLSKSPRELARLRSMQASHGLLESSQRSLPPFSLSCRSIFISLYLSAQFWFYIGELVACGLPNGKSSAFKETLVLLRISLSFSSISLYLSLSLSLVHALSGSSMQKVCCQVVENSLSFWQQVTHVNFLQVYKEMWSFAYVNFLGTNLTFVFYLDIMLK